MILSKFVLAFLPRISVLFISPAFYYLFLIPGGESSPSHTAFLNGVLWIPESLQEIVIEQNNIFFSLISRVIQHWHLQWWDALHTIIQIPACLFAIVVNLVKCGLCRLEVICIVKFSFLFIFMQGFPENYFKDSSQVKSLEKAALVDELVKIHSLSQT